MTNFNEAINEVFKYGLAPAQGWSPFVEKIRSVGRDNGLPAPIETSVLADFFAEQGDPREHILRGAAVDSKHLLQHTIRDSDTNEDAEGHVTLPDGSRVRARVLGETPESKYFAADNPSKVSLSWWANEGKPFVPFHAVFPPDEARSILRRFDPKEAPGVDKLLAMIDRHFPSAGEVKG